MKLHGSTFDKQTNVRIRVSFPQRHAKQAHMTAGSSVVCRSTAFESAPRGVQNVLIDGRTALLPVYFAGRLALIDVSILLLQIG